MSHPFTYVMAGTAFGYCALSAVLGRPASLPWFIFCMLAALVGLLTEHWCTNRTR